VIEVQGLTKYYGETRAIHDLSFRIEQGQIAGFLGLNGAGKSTALKVLAGFLLPTAGTVKVDGVDLLASPEALRASIGYLPEDPPLYDEMTVSGYLTWLGKLRGMSTAAVAARVTEVADLTALADKLNQVIGTLSLGYRKRVGIAQAIIHDPKLVILDEPISGLDPVQIVEMRKLVRALGGKHTILISSHILSEVEETCDQLLMLGDGELIAQGTEGELLGRASTGTEWAVTVAGDGADALQTLAGLDVVEDVRGPKAAIAGARFELTLTGDHPDTVAAALVGAGCALRRLEPTENPLENMFLDLLGTGGAS